MPCPPVIHVNHACFASCLAPCVAIRLLTAVVQVPFFRGKGSVFISAVVVQLHLEYFAPVSSKGSNNWERMHGGSITLQFTDQGMANGALLEGLQK